MEVKKTKLALNPAKFSAAFQHHVTICRLVVFAFLTIALWKYNSLNNQVELTWEYLLGQWWFQHDCFEGILAFLASFVYILFWWALDLLFSSSIDKYRIEKNQNPEGREMARRRMFNEMIGFSVPLILYDFFFPRRQLLAKAPSLFWLVFQLTMSINLYDAFYFFVHLSLHKNSFLYQNLHSKHHLMILPTVMNGLHLILLEGSVHAVCSTLAFSLISSHPLSRAVHNLVLTYLMVELNAGYDMPWMMHNISPIKLYGGAPRQLDHYRYGYCYYQKLGTHFDILFGCEINRHTCGDGSNSLCCYYQQLVTGKNAKEKDDR